MKKELLRITGGSKTENRMELLKDFNLWLYEAEILMITGSTVLEAGCLVELLTGAENFTTGRIYYKGKLNNTEGNTRFLRDEIAEVPKDGGMVENSSLTDNFFVFQDKKRQPFFVRDRRNEKVLKELAERFWVELDVNSLPETLSFLQRYQFQLLKFFYSGKRIVLLDKRKAYLSAEDFNELLMLMRRLKECGMSFIVIDYSVESLAGLDTIVVIKDARTIFHEEVALLSEKQRNQIVENDARPKSMEKPQDSREVILEISQVATERLQDIDFLLHKGEIMAVCYQSYEVGRELLMLLRGLIKPQSGELRFKGDDLVPMDPVRRVKEGIAVIDEFSQHGFLYENLTALQNYCFPRGLKFKRLWSFLRYQHYLEREMDHFTDRRIAKEFPNTLRPSEQIRIRYRAQLLSRPDILICTNPFSSVDQSMRKEVLGLLNEIANQGTAIILFTRHEFVRNMSQFSRYELDRDGHLSWFGEIEESTGNFEYFW